MKIFKAYKIYILQRYKDMWNDKIYFFLETTTPLIYGCIFFLQAIFIYSAKANAFSDLTKAEYILGIFISQFSFMIANYQSFMTLADDVLTSQFDFALLRPINSVFYKYLRNSWDPVSVFMLALYFFASIITMFVIKIPFLIGVKLMFFGILAGIIKLHFFGFITGLVFFVRNTNHVYRIDGAMSASQNAPQEVFPMGFKFILTYIFPAIVTMGFGFEIIRERDGFYFWVLVISWLIISYLMSHIIWKTGIKKYESFS